MHSSSRPGTFRRRAIPVLRIVLFPWLVAWLVGRPFGRVRSSMRRGFSVRRVLLEGAHGFVQLTVAFPLSLILVLEAVMAINSGLAEELPDRGLPPLDRSPGELVLPGPAASAEPRGLDTPVVPIGNEDAPPIGSADVDSGLQASAERELVERFAPVVIQRIGDRPHWDIPVAVDFDGNEDPRDNPANAAGRGTFEPVIHGELTAVTRDSWYLTYSLYHLRDYDHPLRERISRWSHHDNDNEGFHLRVDRRSERVVEIETWFHNRFLYCNRTGSSAGSEPVSAVIQLEDERPIIYAQSHGHGVRCAVPSDSGAVAHSLVLRPAPPGSAPEVTAEEVTGRSSAYRLEDFSLWYGYAARDAARDSTGEMFVGRVPIGRTEDGRVLQLVRYFAGSDRPVGHPARPKPMWGWDDSFDRLPIGAWHVLPSYSFAMRGGARLSHDYERNVPAEELFSVPADVLLQAYHASVGFGPDDRWKVPDRRTASTAGAGFRPVVRLFKAYMNRVFATLG